MNVAGNGPGPDPDAAAAHELLCELRTRITTQPLAYQHGVEARALESLWEIFAQARAAMRNHPGCVRFAQLTADVLNVHVRPVTAKWHRAHAEGRLASRDGADAFRIDLADVQVRLNAFANDLHRMAYGSERQDAGVSPALDPGYLQGLLADLPFGLSGDGRIPVSVAACIKASETLAILTRRELAGTARPPINAVGLALSGGGIRSASFCLGAVQVLADRGLLSDVDYLSTVSGGGYVGAFLTHQLVEPHGEAAVAAPHGPDTEAVRYLRQHAKYLSADHLKERWAMAVGGLAGLLLNWTAPLSLIGLAALALVWAEPILSDAPWSLIFLAAGACVCLGLLSQAFSLRAFGRSNASLGWAIAVTAAACVAWAVPVAFRRFDSLVEHANGIAWPINLTVALATVATAPVLLRFLPILGKPAARNAALKAALTLASIMVPASVVLATYGLWKLGCIPANGSASNLDPFRYGGCYILGAFVVILGLVAFALLDINMTGPHRLYRECLARTFIRRYPGDRDDLPLSETNATGRAPYHLINAAVDLPSGTGPALRERRSDFFTFSRCWSGSPSTGYRPTSEWRAGSRPMDLATAMAISGAAISPHMGLSSVPSLSALLSFLNVRLNYWIKRPDASTFFQAPGFACLLQEMTGIGMDETHPWISLSDGGHIENMGVYELLRRRCKFIISIDGEADPRSTFQGHLTLVRHAQIDFGIRMEPDLSDLRPDPKSGYSQSHAMMVRVRYPETETQPAGDGLILYLKLSVTGDETETIKRYRLLEPDFPHQTTLDQFFNEEQFEAYRQLGVHVAEGLFSRALLPKGMPALSIKDWFSELAVQMLSPEGYNMSAYGIGIDIKNSIYKRPYHQNTT